MSTQETEPAALTFDKRIYLLILAACVIAGLVFYKQNRDRQRRLQGPVDREMTRLAPLFEATDLNNRRVRLNTYIGRHQILMIFFDGKTPVDEEPLLQMLADEEEKLAEQDLIVLAVSTALPQQYRSAIERSRPLPFPRL